MRTPKNKQPLLAGDVRPVIYERMRNCSSRVLSAFAGRQKNQDELLWGLTQGVGQLAAVLMNEAASEERLTRIGAFVIGWVESQGLGSTDVFTRITAERERQNILLRQGKFSYTCASPVADPRRKLRVIVEELGEVAEALFRLEASECKANREHLIEELIQVAAVAVAWLEALLQPEAGI